jgi:hypothetical protein
LPGAGETLGDSRFSGQKCLRDFRRAEAAQHLEREGDLRFHRDRGMTAYEQHPQAVVGEFVFRRFALRRFALRRVIGSQRTDDLGRLVAEVALADGRARLRAA